MEISASVQGHHKPVCRGSAGDQRCPVLWRTTRQKFAGEALASDSLTLTVNGASVTGTKTVPFDGGTVEAGALVGRTVNIGGTVTKVTANTDSQLTVEDNVTASDNAVIYPGEGRRRRTRCVMPL